MSSIQGRLNGNWPQGKNHLLSNCCIAMKKRSRVFTIFPGTFFLFFKTFSRCYGLWVQLTTLKWQLELRLLPLNMPWHCHGSTIIFCITRCLTLIETICWVKPLPTPDSCLSPKKPLSTKLSNVWWKIFFCRKKRKINK